MAEVVVNVKADTGQATQEVNNLDTALQNTENSANELTNSLEQQEARIKTLGGVINIVGGSVEVLAGTLAATGALTKEQTEKFEAAALGAIAFADGAKRIFEGVKELREGLKLATAAQKANNAAVLANPYVAAAAAVVALTVAVVAFTGESESEEDAIDRVTESLDRQREALERNQTVRNNAIALLKIQGADAVAVAEAELQSAKDRNSELNRQINANFAEINRLRGFLNTAGKESAQQKIDLLREENAELGKQQQAAADEIPLAQARLDAAIKQQEAAAQREKEINADRARTRKENAQKAAEADAKAEADLQDKLAQIQRDAELALLDARRKEIGIALDVYREKKALLEANGKDTTTLTEAFNQQVADINAKYDQLARDANERKKQQEDADLEKRNAEKAAVITAYQEALAVSDAEKKALELQRTNEQYDALIAQAAKYGLDTEALEAARQARLIQIEKEGIEEKTKLQEAFESQQVQAAEATLATTVGLLATIRETTDDGTKEGFEKSKKFRIAETRLSSIQAAFDAYKSLVGVPYVGPILAVAAAAAALAAGQKAINDIQNSSFTDTSAPTSPAASNTNINFGAGLGGGSQTLTQTTGAIPPPEQGVPFRAYVVSSDINTTAATEAAIRKRRTL